MLVLFIIASPSMAQKYRETGAQWVEHFMPKDYQAGNANFTIAQDERGVMYFGNGGAGLLEFDGHNWQLFQLPNKSSIYSMAISNRGRIYVGAQNDLGYFQSDSIGQLVYRSLKPLIPEDRRDFPVAWETIIMQDKVYFQTGDEVLIYDAQRDTFNVPEVEHAVKNLFKVDGKIYLRETGKGLMVLNADSLKPVGEGNHFKDDGVYAMLPFPGKPGTILIASRNQGLFKYNGKRMMPFKTEADQFLIENLLYSPGTLLSDGNLLLSTLTGGAVVLDTAGNIVRQYNTETGIKSNKIFYTFQDRAGAIWLATDNGIARIDYASPVVYFDSRNNHHSITMDLIRHNQTMYAGTNDGVFYLDAMTSRFHQLAGSNIQAWSFMPIEDHLLVGTFGGLFRVENSNLVTVVESVDDSFNIQVMQQSVTNPNRVFLGTSTGVGSVVKNGDQWINEGLFIHNTDQKTSLSEDANGDLWMGTFGNGLFCYAFDKDERGQAVLAKFETQHYNADDGLPGEAIWVDKIHGTDYFGSPDSLYLFDQNTRRFYTDFDDPVIAGFYKISDGKGLTFFGVDNRQRVWMGNKGNLNMGEKLAGNSFHWISTPFNTIAHEDLIAVYADGDRYAWFSTGSGILKYDFKYTQPATNGFTAMVRKVILNSDSAIFFGGHAQPAVVPQIAYANNAVKFRFAASNFDGRHQTKFSTLLQGFDESWSAWSVETTKEYTNLPPGKYTFHVKALHASGSESSTGTWAFEILSPWYRTWYAYVVYGLLMLLGFVIIDRLQRRRLLEKERKRSEIERRQKELEHGRAIEKAYNELKATQQQLIHAEKMASLGELTAGIAHEIQNPLNFVNNFSEVTADLINELKEELQNGDVQEVNAIASDLLQNIEKINHHGQRASSIVKSMLEHSRTGAGEKQPTDLNALADEYLRLAYHGFRAKDKSFNAGIKMEPAPDLPKINVVPKDIGRVLLNVINNAFYAVQERYEAETGQTLSLSAYEPMVTVSTRKQSDRIEIRIKDNGGGIPHEIKDKIFQPFFTTKPTGKGTGLGLSLSYDIITKGHGGEFNLETKEGEGTSFIILLPLN